MELLDPLVAADRVQGFEVLYRFLSDGETMPFCRRGAIEIVQRESGRDFGLDPDLDPQQNEVALAELHAWLETEGN